MAVKLRWQPRVIADEQRVYRDTVPFDENSLPSVLATLGAQTDEYIDLTASGLTYYYRIASVLSSSPEILSLSNMAVVSPAAPPVSLSPSIPGGGIPIAPEFTSVYMTSNKTGLSSGGYVFAWDAEHVDTLGAWNSGSPTRLTVPSGCSLVRLNAHVRFESLVALGNIQVRINRNGTAYTGGAPRHISTRGVIALGDNERFLMSGVLPVSPGDYFELAAFWSMSGQDQVIADAGKFYFLMEKIG